MFNLIVMAVALLIFLVSVGITWYNLSYTDKKQKTITIAVLLGIVYIITVLIFKIAMIGTDFGENKDLMKSAEEMLILLVTPINTLLFIPYISTIVNKWQKKEITKEQIKIRAIFIIIVAVILLVFEGFYIRNIENNIHESLQKAIIEQDKATNETTTNQTSTNETTTNNITANQTSIQ